jgi:hypothetical protein
MIDFIYSKAIPGTIFNGGIEGNTGVIVKNGLEIADFINLSSEAGEYFFATTITDNADIAGTKADIMAAIG